MGRPARPSTDGTATSEPSKGFDLFSPGTGMSLVGLGLLALAAVEAAALLVPSSTPSSTSTVRPVPFEALGLLSPMATAESDAAADPQNAVGTGPAAPKVRDKGTAPTPSGSVIGIAATPIPNGTALYRLWSSGAIEAMITTEANIWSDWSSAAPGLTTQKRRPRAPSDNPDTDP
ncbi:MAG: hypothetical protein ACKOJI_12405 [Phycisphaerales bacterium]